uniref:Uncharacterized protein n=1 Tax=Siphoviridae sp. ctES717 TaxID=2827564 RepID=A0A8S5RS98_9CAUD|nr:MAG TPA: hypothetical protein [Siphoviridae sp. ctES717]
MTIRTKDVSVRTNKTDRYKNQNQREYRKSCVNKSFRDKI